MRAAGEIGAPTDQWPLVGRREELSLIGECLAAAPARSVVIVGAAGVGKTRLAQAAATRAQAAGAVVLPAVLGTRAAASIPFGAVADLVPVDGESAVGPQLLRAASAALRRRGNGERMLLVVDDAHLLDPASAALVLHVAGVEELAVVAAVRSDEPCPDAVGALWKDHGALRLDLQPLSAGEVGALLEAGLPGGIVDRRLVSTVARRSGGNPLYCRELVRASLAAGHLECTDGVWRQTGETVVGHRLSELMSERIGTLSEAERTAIELVVLAEPIELELLEGLVGEQIPATLEQRQLLAVDATAPPKVRLGHPLYGDVIGLQLGEVRRRQHSRLLARSFEQRGRLSNRGLLRVAAWRLDAGEADPALVTRAARAAMSLFDRELAVRLASAALELGGGVEAALVLASAETARNRFDAAERALAPWEGRLSSVGDGKAYISQRVPLLRWGLDDPQAASAVLARARTWLPDRAWRQYLQAWSVELAQDGEQIEAAARAGRALLDEADLEPETQLLTTFATAIALLFCGQIDEAQAVGDRSFELARRHAIGLREHAWGTLAAWMAVRLESGRDRGEIEPLARLVHDHALRHDDDELVSLAEITLGRVALAHGELDAAARWLSEAAVHLDECDPRYIRGVCLAMLARTEASRGRADAAAAAQARADDVYPGMQRTHWMYRHEYARARAWVAAANNDLALAQTIALAGADGCGQYVLTEITFLHDALRLGCSPDAVAGRLADLAARTDSELAGTQSDHATAAETAEAVGVAAAGERFAELGARLLGAEALSSAARLHEGQGNTAAARKAETRARELLIASPGAKTPLLGDLKHQALTQRELHVARLAAAGLTNNEIAQRLVVSVRTVESHLYHAFDKLGVSSRNELDQAFIPDEANLLAQG
jgi:DNA-binding NarL/FixJ family response regulator